MSFDIDLALKCLFVCQKVIKILNQLSLHDFLLLFSPIIADEKDTIDCVSILIENNSIVKLPIVVLGLIDHALNGLQVAKEIEKSLCLDAFIAVYI